MNRSGQPGNSSIVAIVAILAILLIGFAVFRVIQQQQANDGGLPNVNVNMNDDNGSDNPLY